LQFALHIPQNLALLLLLGQHNYTDGTKDKTQPKNCAKRRMIQNCVDTTKKF